MKKQIIDEHELFMFGIVCDKQVIATFKNDQDRDDCIAFLKDRYEDCDFSVIDYD
jgi:hypothetical protein